MVVNDCWDLAWLQRKSAEAPYHGHRSFFKSTTISLPGSIQTQIYQFITFIIAKWTWE